MKALHLPVLAAALAGLATSCAPTPIERHAWVTGLRPERAAYYHKLHAHPWPTVNARLKACNVRDYSIYEREIGGKLYLFSYLEYTGKDFAADMKKMEDDPETKRWWKETDPCQAPLPDAVKAHKVWSDTKELYHLQ